MKRILIIGVDSLIGKALYNALKKTFIVYGTSRKKETSFYNLNLIWELKKWPHLPDSDVIICCAAMTSILECENKKKLSKKVNIDGLKKIIKKYKKKIRKLFFFQAHVYLVVKSHILKKKIYATL